MACPAIQAPPARRRVRSTAACREITPRRAASSRARLGLTMIVRMAPIATRTRHANKTDSFMCGTSFENASSSCDRPCPTKRPTECPSHMSCYTCDAHTTKDDMSASSSAINTTSPPYIPGDSYYCGTSFLEASSQCTHPCPTRMDSECPDGEQCYGITPCPLSTSSALGDAPSESCPIDPLSQDRHGPQAIAIACTPEAGPGDVQLQHKRRPET